MPSPDFIVGIIGNVISVLLCASPMGTFWELTTKKSAENYDALPYISQLLCKSLWAFYGILDPDGLLIVTVNSISVISQMIYVSIYLHYVPKDKKVKSLVLVGILNIGFPGSVTAAALLAFNGNARLNFVGIVCAAVTVGMYAAPISVMRTVVKTKSVEYMSFFVSFFLLLNAAAWFTFSLILRDYYVIVPNVIGMISGLAQLIIYAIYYKIEESSSDKSNADIGQLEAAVENKADEEVMRNRSASLPKPAISRDYSVRVFLRTVSLSKYESRSGFLLVP